MEIGTTYVDAHGNLCFCMVYKPNVCLMNIVEGYYIRCGYLAPYTTVAYKTSITNKFIKTKTRQK